ncbi:porin [Robbsia sp. Bb-Pol-6]|uniref:Porin n=1 Tax=Robbsia betulipollinis TaxID=2981849 RepID=A0ABT3ZNA2_9BURK|nr:porin [Robbsia betulipollinis]MCY0388016.1 porin [Robbsia betulipollinis]
MKRSLLGVALTLLASGTYAQGSVTLYGIIDAGLTYVSNEGGHRLFEAQDGANFGNRIGFKGTEDLGGGMKALFVLENGFSLNTGVMRQGGLEFGRQAFVGLSNPYGTLTLGRQYDFIYDYITPFNLNGYASVYSGHMGDFDRIAGDQLNNTVKFQSATYGGFSFGVMYGFGNVSGDFHEDSSWSAGIGYKMNGFSAAAVYTRVNDVELDPYAQIGVTSFLGQTMATRNADGTVTDLDSSTYFTVDRESIAAVGASYSFVKLTLAGNFTSTHLNHASNSATMNVCELGAMYFITPSVIALGGYEYTTFASRHWNQPTFGMQYLLSKRTWLYANVSYLRASSGVDANQGAGFYSVPSSTRTQTVSRVAMIHTF